MSQQDKIVLHEVLQDLADELRRIKRERKKHQEEREVNTQPCDIQSIRVSKG